MLEVCCPCYHGCRAICCDRNLKHKYLNVLPLVCLTLVTFCTLLNLPSMVRCKLSLLMTSASILCNKIHHPPLPSFPHPSLSPPVDSSELLTPDPVELQCVPMETHFCPVPKLLVAAPVALNSVSLSRNPS